MPIKPITSFLYSILIPVFGLVSCSVNKTDPNSKPDIWVAPNLMLERENEPEFKQMDLRNSKESVRSTDTIRFTHNSGETDKSIRTLQVDSQCSPGSNGTLLLKNSVELRDISTFRIVDTLGTNVLSLPDEQIRCNFTIRIFNSNQSSKSYVVTDRIVQRVERGSLKVISYDSQSPVKSVRRKEFAKIGFQNEKSQSGEMEFICDKFTTRLKTPSLQSERLETLAAQPLVNNSGFARDPRALFHRQTCQILFRADDPVRTVSLSPLLQVHFGAPEIRTELRLATDYPIPPPTVTRNGHETSSFPAVSLLIINPNDFPVTLGLTRQDLQAHYQIKLTRGSVAVTHPRSSPIIKIPPNFASTTVVGDYYVFNLKPKEKVDLTIPFYIPNLCRRGLQDKYDPYAVRMSIATRLGLYLAEHFLEPEHVLKFKPVDEVDLTSVNALLQHGWDQVWERNLYSKSRVLVEQIIPGTCDSSG